MNQKIIDILSKFANNNQYKTKKSEDQDIEEQIDELENYIKYKIPNSLNTQLRTLGYIIGNGVEFYQARGILKINQELRNDIELFPEKYYLPPYLVQINQSGDDVEYFLNFSKQREDGECPVEAYYVGIRYDDPRNQALRNKAKYPNLNFETFEDFFVYCCKIDETEEDSNNNEIPHNAITIDITLDIKNEIETYAKQLSDSSQKNRLRRRVIDPELNKIRDEKMKHIRLKREESRQRFTETKKKMTEMFEQARTKDRELKKQDDQNNINDN